MRKRLLPDINIWLALIFDSHVHHKAAKKWIDSLTDETCYFCRVSQPGFLRLANNPRAFPTDAVSMAAAWGLYDLAMTDSRIVFADEPAQIESVWRTYTQSPKFAPNEWNDAYLAAFAETGGYEIVTFDQGFKLYPNLTVTMLK